MKAGILKITSLILVIAMMFSIGSVSVSASADYTVSAQDIESPDASDGDKIMWNAINALLQGILRTMCFVYPNPDWKHIDEYDRDEVNFLEGRDEFLTEAAENAQWKLGYDKESIIPEDFEAGKYYMGRKLNIVSFDSAAKVQSVLDDQFCRAVCVDDGSGKGAVVMAVIDGIGVTSTDVREIRERLEDLTDGGKIASINVSATHCHSVIDTQGVSSSFLLHLFLSPICNLFGIDELPFTDAEQNFKKVMYDQSAKAIRDAYNAMEAGDLYYKTIDGSEFIRDKKAPYSYSKDIVSLRFVPAEGDRETYLINMAAHPTSFSYRNEVLSSDYPYYMDERFNENNANFVLYMGAVGQIGRENSTVVVPEDSEDPYIQMKEYGRAIAQHILDNKDEEEKLQPVLNAVHDDFSVTCTNYLLLLAVKCRLVNNVCYKTGISPNSGVLPTEIGYVELGNKVGFALYPAELYPEVYWGGAFSADVAWDGTDWKYSENCMSKMNRENIDMYPICFANDTVGYVVPDNDFAFLAHEPDELLSAGKYTASTIVEAFIDLMAQVGEMAK